MPEGASKQSWGRSKKSESVQRGERIAGKSIFGAGCGACLLLVKAVRVASGVGDSR